MAIYFVFIEELYCTCFIKVTMSKMKLKLYLLVDQLHKSDGTFKLHDVFYLSSWLRNILDNGRSLSHN